MHTTTQTTTKHLSKAEQVRAELKAAGIKRHAVSVRGDRNSIDCVIKDADVSYAIVSTAANRHESISRCEYSGEILCGGNTYVSVTYADEIVAAVSKKLLPLLDGMMKSVDWNGFSVSYDEAYARYNVWFQAADKDYGSHVQAAFNLDSVAAVIAVRALSEGVAKF